MLLHLISHLSYKNLFMFLLYALIVGNVIMMLRQQSIIFFLGYKIIFLIYLGGGLVYLNLDILALILGIVYGSFVVVIFIFSFLWLDTQHPTRLAAPTPRMASATVVTSIVVACILAGASKTHTYNTFFTVHGLNHYELLNLHNSEEIECLGGGLSTENLLLMALVSGLLSIACLVSVILIIFAKKAKWGILRAALLRLKEKCRAITTSVRKQLSHQQEARNIVTLNKVYKHIHNRRA